MTTKTEAESIAALARDGAEPRLLTDKDGRTFLIVASGQHAVDVTDRNRHPAALPQHVEQGVVLQSIDSLITYLNRFKADETILLCDITGNTMAGLLDYHGAAGEQDKGDHLALTPPTAGHNAHRATLTLPYSEEWKTWTAVHGKLLPQLEFARFLEENGVDVVAPDGAELLEVCRDLQAKRKVDFRKAVRTASDNESFEYADTTEASSSRGSIEMPTKFLLQIPVYFDTRPVELYAFLRWKLEEGEGLKLGVQLHRAEHVRQAMFRELVDAAAQATDVPAMYGKAERVSRPSPLDATTVI